MWKRHGCIFNKIKAQGPTVDVLHNKLKIYFSTRDKNNKSEISSIDVCNKDMQTVLQQNENRLITKGEFGEFDAEGVMVSCILTKDNQKYLYYIGCTQRIDVPFHNTIGLAKSIDEGETWLKCFKGPIFSTSKSQPHFLASSDVIYKDGVYHMIYTSGIGWYHVNGKIEPHYHLRHATSSNAIDWTPQDIAIDLEDGEGGMAKPCIRYINNKYYIWYCVRKNTDHKNNPENTYRIRCAVSSDLINWKKINTFNLDPDSNFKGEDIMTAYPNILFKDGMLHMYYNGNNYGDTGIFYATLDSANLTL